MTHINPLQTALRANGEARSPAHKRFDALLRQIEKARAALAEWQEQIPLFRRSFAEVVLPLQDKLLSMRRDWVFAIDVALRQAVWTRAERKLLIELLCETAREVLFFRVDDAELTRVFDKHSDQTFEDIKREGLDEMKVLTEMFTGVDLGRDETIDNEAQLFERLNEHLQQESAAEAERAAARAQRRKSAAQQRRDDEAKLVTQSVRDIYRKLASALHPDREADPRRRDEKTALMQKVNQAYERNDLLTLLEVQLEIEQIDAEHVASADVDRVKRYNKVLAEQLEELKAEVSGVALQFSAEFELDPGFRLAPGVLGALLKDHIRVVRTDIAAQRRRADALAMKPAAKIWLKAERRQRENDRMTWGDDEFF